MATEAKLLQSFLVSGPIIPGAGNMLQDDSLELVRGFPFVMKGKGGNTLMIADENGIIHSVDKKLTPMPQPKQHPAGVPLTIYILPKGTMAITFLADGDSWQKELLDEFNRQQNDASLGIKPMQTVPITFEKRHLKKPGDYDDDSLKEAYDAIFADGKKYAGQLMPKLKMVAILVSKKAFVSPPPPTAAFSDELGNAHKVFRTEEPFTLTYESAFTEENTSSDFMLFFIQSDATKQLKTGKHIFKLSKSGLNQNLQKWCTNNKQDGITFSCEVGFGISSLIADMDLFVFDPIALEESVIQQFPEKYMHLHKRMLLKKEDGGTDPESAGEKGLVTWIRRYEWIKESRELLSDYAETKKRHLRIGIIGNKVLSLIKSGSNLQSQGKEDTIVSILQSNWSAAFDIAKTIDSWDDYIRNKYPRLEKVLTLISVDKDWFGKSFSATAFRNHVMEHLRQESPFLRRLNALKLSRLKNDAEYSEKALRLLFLDGMPKAAVTAPKIFAKFAGRGLGVLDTGWTLFNAIGTVREYGLKRETYDVYNSRFTNSARDYGAKFGTHANLTAIPYLEALRKSADISYADMKEAEKKIVDSALECALGLTVLIPVAGDFAALFLLGKATVEAASNALGVLCSDIDRLFLDSVIKDAGDHYSRITILEQEYSANMRAIMALKKAGTSDTDPAIQFRVRVAIIIGLVRLIERCGSRYDKNTPDFERKVKQYDIAGYIKTYLLGDLARATISIQTTVPIDELWLFVHGNNEGWGIVVREHAYSLLTEKWWGLPLFLMAPTSAEALTGINAGSLSAAPHCPVAFQAMFPVHAMDSESTTQLAKTLCNDFSAANKKGVVVFTCIYVRDARGKWATVRDYAANTANPPVTPFTEARIVVVFKGVGDLSGLPVSLQLFRKSMPLETAGPVYKGMTSRLVKSHDNSGDDKGLLTGTSEEPFISSGANSYYGCVFHPFYYFGNAIVKGIKPCGFVGFSAHPAIKMEFRAGIGDDARHPVKTAQDAGSVFSLQLPMQNPACTAMIIDRAFLNNKTAAETAYPVFLPTSNPRLCAFLLKEQSGKWRVFKPDAKPKAGVDFAFDWTRPFEILFLFQASSFSEKCSQSGTVSFAASMTAYEDGLISDTEGPSYCAEAICLDISKSFAVGEVLASATLNGLLRKSGVLQPTEGVIMSALDAGSLIKNQAGYLFASRVGCAYSVEDESEREAPYNALKPFGASFKQDPIEGYSYRFILHSKGAVLPELKTPFMNFPGLPAPATWKHLSNKQFVTKESIRKLSEVKKSDYE